MRTLMLVLVAIICLGITVPARADWQYTRWGMSVDEALAASKGQLRRCDQSCKGQNSETQIAHLYGPYRSGDFAFTAFAQFEKATGKLGGVSLNLSEPVKVHNLIGALRTKYGEPTSRSQTAVLELWVWRDKSDQISVMAIGTGATALVSLKYQPRLTDSNRGL